MTKTTKKTKTTPRDQTQEQKKVTSFEKKSEEKSLTQNRHIAPFLSQNFFMDYSPLFNCMANNSTLSDATNKIHKMSDPENDNPYTSTQADNARTAAEILQYQFVRHLGVETVVNQKQNLLSTLNTILQEAGYPQDKIDSTLKIRAFYLGEKES